MSDIFKEVDEAMQQEKLLNLWNKYKSTIIGAIVLLLVTASGTTFYKNWDFRRDTNETARLIEALDQNNTAEILANLKDDTRGGHAAIASFTAAGLALENGEAEKASTLYLDISKDGSAPKDLRDLARLLYVKNTDDADYDVLKPVISNKKSPWRWHAMIEAAVANAKAEEYDAALKMLSVFKEDGQNIPFALQQRAEALSHVYALKKNNINDENPS